MAPHLRAQPKAGAAAEPAAAATCHAALVTPLVAPRSLEAMLLCSSMPAGAYTHPAGVCSD